MSVCVGVHRFNNHVCSRGALECLSTPRRQGYGLTGVCGGPSGLQKSTMCLFRPGRRQPRYRRTPVRRGRSSGGMSTFQCDYRERHNYDCTNTVMDCVTPMLSSGLLVCDRFRLCTISTVDRFCRDNFGFWSSNLNLHVWRVGNRSYFIMSKSGNACDFSG